MQEYAETFGRQQDLKLLRQALDGGQISMIEYFVEVSVIYQSQANLLQLENQYSYFFRQVAATDAPLLRIEVVGPVADILYKTKRKIPISKQYKTARGRARKGDGLFT